MNMKHTVSRKQYLRRGFRHSRKWFALAVIAMLVLSAYNIVFSWLLQMIIDIVSGYSTLTILQIGIISVSTFLIFMAAYLVYRVARPKYLYKAVSHYKQELFDKMIEKNIASFQNENTSLYLSMYANDIKVIEEGYYDSFLKLLDLLVSFIGALALMLFYSPLLTLLSIVLSLLPVAVSLPAANKLAETEKEVSNGNSSFVSMMKDILSGFPVIKSFRAENEMKHIFSSENKRIETLKYKRRYVEESIDMWGTAAGMSVQLGVFIIGAWMAIAGYGVTPGVVLVFLQLMNFVISPIEQVPNILAKRKAALALVDKMLENIHENQEKIRENQIGRLTEGISLKNVDVRIGEQQILQDINYDFKQGKKYAIIGSSGSGKSTLVNTILGGCTPSRGEVLFDGTDSRTIQQDSLFDAISLVQQHVFVFDDTIRNNITLFKSFNEELIRDAAERAGLDSLIKRQGMDYICGENGNRLSGGEKQRIAIARALLRGSQVLMLDEATAALDNETSFNIVNSILEMDDMTEIIITHRLEEKLLHQYDELLVMHEGTIIEHGTFDELRDKKGYFYLLYMIAHADEDVRP